MHQYIVPKKSCRNKKKINRKLLDLICFWQTRFCAYILESFCHLESLSERLSSEQGAFME